MRVINAKYETIGEYDANAGELVAAVTIREDAKPIDNVTKFAWADEDYEEVMMYLPHAVKTAAEEIAELKIKLRETDFQILKIVEGAATLKECAAVIAQRAAWRKEINEWEAKEHGN